MKKVALGSVADVVMGTAPPGESYNSSGEGMPLVAGAGDYGSVNPRPKKYTTAASAVAQQGDLIICVRATIGDLNWADREYCLGRGVAALRPKNGALDARFLAYFMDYERESLARKGTGSTFPAIRRKDLTEFEIPLPPLAEQRRIADILDKADAIRRKRREAVASIRPMIESLFNHHFGYTISNPKGWEIRPLEDVVANGTSVTYGIVQCGPHVADGVPYIRTSDITGEQVASLESFGRTDPAIAARFERSTVRKGELVFAIRASVGAVVPVPDYLDGANLTQGTARIAPGPKVTAEYLLWCLRSPQMQDWVDRQCKGATFREITLSRLRSLPVPLPPIDWQKRFSDEVELANRIAAGFGIGDVDSEAIFGSLVQSAFRGEL